MGQGGEEEVPEAGPRGEELFEAYPKTEYQTVVENECGPWIS